MKDFVCEFCGCPVIKYPDKVLKCTNCGHIYPDEWGVEHRRILPDKGLVVKSLPVGGKRDAYNLWELGNKYINSDPEFAAKKFEESAALGNMCAAQSLGIMKLLGQGIPKDAEGAAKYFEQSLVYSESKFYLAAMSYNGDGVTKDKEKAAKLYQQAADDDHIRAAHYFATMCERGDGVPMDKQKAAKYYEMSVSDPESSYYLAQMKLNGAGIEENPREAVILLSGISDIPQAAFFLGVCFNEGIGISRDRELARMLFRYVATKDLDFTKDYIRESGLL